MSIGFSDTGLTLNLGLRDARLSGSTASRAKSEGIEELCPIIRLGHAIGHSLCWSLKLAALGQKALDSVKATRLVVVVVVGGSVGNEAKTETERESTNELHLTMHLSHLNIGKLQVSSALAGSWAVAL